ncbi:MAG: hypothetical protein GY772_17615 [bacterium]|nr:hypothetical protein [bacterium]
MAVTFKTFAKYRALQWMTQEHMIVISIGHDVASAASVRKLLEKEFPAARQFVWKPLVPVMQTYPRMPAGGGYVEYLLLGYGQQSVPHPPMGWVGVSPAYPPKKLRLVPCKHRSEEPQGTGRLFSNCPVTSWARGHFCVPLDSGEAVAKPQVAKKRTAEAELLGESDGEAEADKAQDASSMSESAGRPDDEGDAHSESITESEAPAATASAKVQRKGSAWARPFRQGMDSGTWLRVLEATHPPQVVLASPCQWQAGLLMATLRQRREVRRGPHVADGVSSAGGRVEAQSQGSRQ